MKLLTSIFAAAVVMLFVWSLAFLAVLMSIRIVCIIRQQNELANAVFATLWSDLRVLSEDSWILGPLYFVICWPQLVLEALQRHRESEALRKEGEERASKKV